MEKSMARTLTYKDLAGDERTALAKLENISTVDERMDKQGARMVGPLGIVRGFLTMGLSAVTDSIKVGLMLFENDDERDSTIRAYLKALAGKYDCDYVDWKKFPSSKRWGNWAKKLANGDGLIPVTRM
jgi:hypothetical protein